MRTLTNSAILGLAALVAAAALAQAEDAPPPAGVIAAMDLSGPFDTRSPWRFTAKRGQPVDDPNFDGERDPGVVQLCLRKDASGPCDPNLRGALRPPSKDDVYSDAHYLDKPELVHPRGAAGRPILLLRTASRQGVNGDQLVFTQALAYRRDRDRFERAYGYLTRRNHDEEVRYIGAGPLKGDIVSADPTDNAPSGFWVVVNALTPAYAYRPVLRYRSATRYGDGNPLAVIDSEMPNIERRLGLWRPGLPLPLPAGGCPTPRLIRMALWCR